jgi:hypothetical protein
MGAVPSKSVSHPTGCEFVNVLALDDVDVGSGLLLRKRLSKGRFMVIGRVRFPVNDGREQREAVLSAVSLAAITEIYG